MLEEKLRNCFDDMVVYKDLKKSNFFNSLSLPSFLRDWVLNKYADENGNYDVNAIDQFIRKYIPKDEDWFDIKDRLVINFEKVKIVAKIKPNISIDKQLVTFSLPDLGLTDKDTIIENYVWENISDAFKNPGDIWGVITLGYKPPVDKKDKGKIKLLDFVDFRPYSVDTDFYSEVRSEFETEEWIDILLGAIDYNPMGYRDLLQKITMLKRLLPFVEKRINLIELAPKGTGKSYLFGRVSRYGWLSTGGVMSRAKMFYDIGRKATGLVNYNDYVALDEIQTINFTDVAEMRACLKGYMEQGDYTVGNYSGKADAGIILLGNISVDNMDISKNMFQELPDVFQESALLDRFHGFIEGWNIPRMTADLKMEGFALNSEYFCSMLHALRDAGIYRSIVDELIEIPVGADERHTEAVKRITTAFLKLLFPNAKDPSQIEYDDFMQYCLSPAMCMRRIISGQLSIMDKEYKKIKMPDLDVKLKYRS